MARLTLSFALGDRCDALIADISAAGKAMGGLPSDLSDRLHDCLQDAAALERKHVDDGCMVFEPSDALQDLADEATRRAAEHMGLS